MNPEPQTVSSSIEPYQLALEAAGLGIWDNDLLTGTIAFAGHAHKLFGLERGQTTTIQELLDRMHPADRARTEAKIKACLDPGTQLPYDNEYRIVERNSEKVLRWLRSRGRVFFTEEGIPYRFTGTVQDISAEVRSRENQQKLLALVDNSIELMSILENDNTNSYINKAGMNMLGFDSIEQVNATPISELHTPEDLAFVQVNVLPGVIGQGRWSGRMNVRHLKTGEVFPVYNNTVRIHDPVTGEPLAVGAVMRDMRPEVAARRALEESEKNFRTLVMQAPVGICILRGEDLVFELANDSYLALVQARREELIGRKVVDALPEAAVAGFDGLLRQVLRTGEGFQGREAEVIQVREGASRRLFVDFTYERLEDSDRIMAVVIDVTDKVLARQRLQEAEEDLQLRVAERTSELERKNRELEEFTYVTSHDLQEPIRKIQIFLDMIGKAEGEKFAPESSLRFGKVMEAAHRMSQSLKDLLHFVALSNAEMVTEVDLDTILDHVESDLELLIETKGARIQRDPLPRLPGIPHQLHRLFYNLLNNALKFACPGIAPFVRIQVKIEKGYCLIEVADNGVGFEQEQSEKIFALFQRLHTREEFGGTGIGLSICRKVVNNHGGEIRAESSPGEGARFIVRLPTNT